MTADVKLPQGRHQEGSREQAPPNDSVGCLPSQVDGPLRIAVRCMSHKIPGQRGHRMTTMGNLICQHQWGRDMDTERDLIRTTGFPQVDGKKVDFLLDTGTALPGTRPEDIPILAYRWSGQTLRKRDLGTHLQSYIRQSFPFKRERTRSAPAPGKTASDFEKEMSRAEFDQYMRQMVFRKFEFARFISRSENAWLATHPDEFDGVMRDHIARARWHKLPLSACQELWLAEHRGVPDPDLMHRVLERHRLQVDSTRSTS